MEPVLQLLHYLASFFIVLSVIVFVHEFGHYIVAKLCGVRIEAFSIGFGKEVWGFNDRSGTRWKISWLPLGGYVKMFGDSSAASTADAEALENLSLHEKAQTFHFKPLHRKAAIVAAGPLFNFLLTTAILTYFIMTAGLPSTEPVVGEVLPQSAALEAGLKKGDRILTVNEEKVSTFNDISYLIATNLSTPVTIALERDGKLLSVILTPKQVEDDDGLGNKALRPLIGIKSTSITYQDVGIATALGESVKRTYMICSSTLKVLGQIILGERGAHDLKGPVGIAQLSGQAADKDAHTVLWLIAMLSANLGLVNLLPIPLLDGGHLMYYSIEALRGRPMAQRLQEWGFKFGFAVLLTMMAFTLFNDVKRLLF